VQKSVIVERALIKNYHKEICSENRPNGKFDSRYFDKISLKR